MKTTIRINFFPKIKLPCFILGLFFSFQAFSQSWDALGADDLNPNSTIVNGISGHFPKN
jgi:hypothetical protein